MILQRLLEDVNARRITGVLTSDIKGIAYDSRLVGNDFMFVALRGFSVDGHGYIHEALNRGATAIVGEAAVDKTAAQECTAGQKCAYIEVADSREALALISAAFYGYPSRSLSLVGITGTNGKTTTSYITKNIIEAEGKRAGLIGTIRYVTGGGTGAAVNTTPESLDLQRYLSEMVSNKMDYAVVEVSSHALSLKRVAGCSLRVAAFTNFTQDHLDFHGDMDEYFNAKRDIFRYLNQGGSDVLNVDDPMIRPLARELSCTGVRNVITCGINSDATIRAMNIREQRTQNKKHKHTMPAALSFTARTPLGEIPVNSCLIGRFNVYNILMSIGIAYALGIHSDAIEQGLRSLKSVEGRFERIEEGQDFLAIVDYAHTEDALRNVIETARSVTERKVITVFGCGGDRDRAKRPRMGEAATALSDFVIITSDNPRSEDPADIVSDIIHGLKKTNYSVQHDRAEAIAEAVSMAREGDTVIIAGKGHEDYQESKGKRVHFSDKEVLRREIGKRLAANNHGSN
jgi:UDP-N-acetylmuramoyl-L-alanyl-D-glutamate--2,6-diaminopimelate ligase